MKTRFSMNGFNVIINIIFWMMIAHFAKDSGMGIFFTAYILYGFLYMILMGSILNTISKMVSVRCYRGLHENAKKVFQYGLMYSFIMGLCVCAAFMIFGDLLTKLLCGSTLPTSILKILGVYFFLQSVSKCLIGFYQGIGNVLTYNITTLLKDFLLVISAPFIINLFYGYGEKVGALTNNSLYGPAYGAMGAAVLLCMVSLITLIMLILFFGRTIHNSNTSVSKSSLRGIDDSKSFFNNFIAISFRVLRNNLFPTTAFFVVLVLYMNIALKNGMNYNTLFTNIGIVFGKLVVVCMIPVCLFREYVSKEKMKIHNDYNHEETKNVRIRSGYFIKNSLFILLPITTIAITLAKPIVMIFFGGHMKLGVSMLQIGGVMILLSGMTMVLKAILTAIQKETVILLYSLVAFVFTIVFAIVVFGKNTSISMLVYSFVFYYAVSLILFAFAVYTQPRVILKDFKYRFIIMGIATALVAGVELLLDYLLVMNILWLILSVLIGYTIYIALMFILKGITKRDEQALKDSFLYLPIHFISSKLHLWK